MHARPRTIAAQLIALFVLAISVLVAAGSAPASAATVPSAATQACVKPPPRNDDSIHIQGCLRDTRETPPAPVPDVKISVEDDSGKEVGTGTSNETGVFDIALPGKSIDILGKTYTIKIDKKSLPEGADLRNPKQVALKTTIKLDSDVYVTFPIGNATAAG